jgi:hypothetical protein
MKIQTVMLQSSSRIRFFAAVVVIVTVCWFSPAIARVFADGVDGTTQIQSFFAGTSGFLIKTLGTGVFLLGLIVAGIKIAAGDHNGMRSAIMVMVGGAVIFLSQAIVSLLSQFAGLQ